MVVLNTPMAPYFGKAKFHSLHNKICDKLYSCTHNSFDSWLSIGLQATSAILLKVILLLGHIHKYTDGIKIALVVLIEDH